MKDGIWFDLSREKYDAEDRANWSSIKELAKSPAHYLKALKAKREPTPSQVLGQAFHLAVLEPQRFLREVVSYEGTRRGKEWDAFQKEHEGRLILRADDFQTCLGMQRSVWDNPEARRYFEGGNSEASVFWEHRFEAPGVPAYTVKCKSRDDYLGPLGLTELKGTKDASPLGFPREAARYRYAGQMAMQADGVRAIKENDIPPCHIIAVEWEPPHAVSVWHLPEQTIDAGRTDYWQAIDRLHQCRTRNEFPAWPGVRELVLPAWGETTYEDVFQNEEAA